MADATVSITGIAATGTLQQKERTMAKVALVNLGDQIDHAFWANTPVDKRIGRYNEKTNETIYAIASEDATKEDIDNFFKDYPDHVAID